MMTSEFHELRKDFDKRFDETVKEIDNALADARRMAAVCEWIYNERQDCWATGCGNILASYEGIPSENWLHYCPYCGRKLSELPPEGVRHDPPHSPLACIGEV